MARDEIEEIKAAAGEYAELAIAARRSFLELRVKQDPEIRKVLTRAASQIAAMLRRSGSSLVSDRLLSAVKEQLTAMASSLRDDYAKTLERHIQEAVDIGVQPSKSITIDLMTAKVKSPLVTRKGLEELFVRVNQDAVRAIWSRTEYGLRLSDRIWNMSRQNVEVMTKVVQDAVAMGQDAVSTARLLEQYVRPEENVPVKYMKGLMERTGGIPQDLSYQALRTARTETTAALGQGTIRAAQVSPSAIGIQFCLSPAHKVRDRCDELAAHNEGLGPGVYPLTNPPPYPAHPNTLSFLVEKHLDSDDFVSDLLAWIDEPDSRPNLNDWYQTVYKPTTS